MVLGEWGLGEWGTGGVGVLGSGGLGEWGAVGAGDGGGGGANLSFEPNHGGHILHTCYFGPCMREASI